MVLYHAVSSYQLLETILHKEKYHASEPAILVLPDFITEKYPQYKKLKTWHIFTEVILFPYLLIPHDTETSIQKKVTLFCRQKLPCPLKDFQEIYIAGAHFYFTLQAIHENCPFTFFEDAAGMLGKAEVLYENLKKSYPLHAKIARKYGLFDGSNPLVKQIICKKGAQTSLEGKETWKNFDVEEELALLEETKRKQLLRFFRIRKIHTRADILLLTQNFSGLGVMSEKEQKQLYVSMKKKLPQRAKLVIKPHPDDKLDYKKIFPNAKILKKPFPSELLPYLFKQKPFTVYTFDSAGCENLKRTFKIQKIGREISCPIKQF